MNSTSMLWLVAKRDLTTRARSRAFQISSALLALGVAVVVGLSWVTGGEESAAEATLGLTDDAARFADRLDADTDDLITTIRQPATINDLTSGDIDALFDGSSITWEADPWFVLDVHIRAAVAEVAVLDKAAEAGLTPTQLGSLFEVDEPEEVRLDGSEQDEGTGLRLIAAMVAAGASTFLIQIWGSFLTMGVIEEKASRIVEILLSQVRPTTLLGGKILGIGSLALLQLLIVIGGLIGGLLLTDSLEIPAEVWGTVPLFAITFVLGFGFYATLFAAVGATVSRQEDATSVQMPVLIPLFAGWFVVVAGVNAPDSLALAVASFVPFTSPIAMPARYALGTMPLWQVAASLLLLIVTALLMVRVAAAVYRSSLLRTGGRTTLRQAWQTRREAEI